MSDFSSIGPVSTGIVIPKLATFVARISGTVTAAPNLGNPCGTAGLTPITFGPGANTDALLPPVYLLYGDATEPSSFFAASPTVWEQESTTGAETEVLVSRGGYGAAIGCNAPDGSRIGGPLFTMSSSQSIGIEITRIGTVILGVRPQLVNPVPKDTTVVFAHWNDGDTWDFTYRVDSWVWAPSDGSPSKELFPNDCGFSCRFRVTSSGTMTVSGTVGGFRDGSRKRVSASSTVAMAGDNPTLALKSDKTDIVLGDSIVLTTESSDPAFTVVGYDSPAPVVSTRIGGAAPLASRASLDAKKTPLAADGMNARSSSVSNGIAECGPAVAASSCFAVPDGAGEWVVNAYVNGKPEQARVMVNVKIPTLVVECKQDSPTRLAFVTCSATVDVPRSFRMTRQKSVALGSTLVDEPLRAVLGSGEAYPWRGRQGAPTKITMWAEINGKALKPALAEFDVSPRSGSEWAPMDSWPIAPPAPIAARGSPLKVAYPSFTQLPDTFPNYTWETGSLGATTAPDLDTPTASFISRGPNRGIAYYTRGVLLSAPPAIYVATSLFYTDRFYLDQRGGTTASGRPYCGSEQMGSLHLGVFHHEKGHYRDARKLMATQAYQDVVEGVVGVIALDDSDQPATGASMTSLQRFEQEQAWTIIDTPWNMASDKTHNDPEYDVPRPECTMRFQGDR